jgi:RNA 2',3'-cyclic 3'-phosphodiesterase
MTEAQPKPLRLFVAIFAPEPVRTAAAAVQEALRGKGDVRWVRPEHLHLTLKFLGPIPAGQVDPLAEALQKTANTFSTFVLKSGAVEAFPNSRNPRTLWLGLGGPEASSLVDLAAAVEAALVPLGVAAEARPYRPHLTLGRVRSPRGIGDLATRLREVPPPAPVSWPVREVELVQSMLGPAGSEYTSLSLAKLRQ